LAAASVQAQRELPAAAASLADEIAMTKVRSLAVVDFTDLQGNVTELGRFIAEEMALGLVTAKKQLSVIDRTHLRALLQEHKLASSGIIDPATARKLGEIAGVEALVTGTITPLGDSVRLVVKVLDTNTARILAASSVELAKTRTIEELMARDIGGTSSSQGHMASPSVLAPTSVTDGRPSTSQTDAIRISVGQVGVTSDAYRAALSVIVENTSKDPIYLALQNTLEYNGLNAVVALSDDKGSAWIFDSLSGIERRPVRTDVKYSEAIRANENYTLIPPGGRTAIVMHFRNAAGNTSSANIGSLFSFGAQGVRFTPSGVSRFSIGLTGIKGTIVNR
jgi:TolB-like protein